MSRGDYPPNLPGRQCGQGKVCPRHAVLRPHHRGDYPPTYLAGSVDKAKSARAMLYSDRPIRRSRCV